MADGKLKLSTSARLAGMLAVLFGVVVHFGAMPLPRALSGGTLTERLDARLSYHWQALQHVAGFREDFDKAWLLAKLAKLVPNATHAEWLGREPELGSIEELDAAHDPEWRAKFSALYGSRRVPAKPVVVRKLTHADRANFPGVREWNLETLSAAYGDHRIPVFTDCAVDKSVIFMPFSQFTAEMRDTSKQRYARCISDVNGTLARGLNTRHVSRMTGKSLEHAASAWVEGRDTHCAFIGGKHVHSRLHSDFGASVFFQIEGRKRWVFFPPSESALLFPRGHRHNVAYNADLDIFAPDLATHYLHGALTGYEVILEPGDVLFFPAFWWHAVQNLDDVTVGVDFPVVDALSSWQVNSVLLGGTLLNGNMLLEVARGLLAKSEGSVKDVFFNYYAKDGQAMERV